MPNPTPTAAPETPQCSPPRPLGVTCRRAATALKHPLLKEGGILSPLVASLAQWHLVDDPEQGLGLTLTDALKSTLREADGLKRALCQVRVVW